jgi:hypothetical protein
VGNAEGRNFWNGNGDLFAHNPIPPNTGSAPPYINTGCPARIDEKYQLLFLDMAVQNVAF